MPHAIIEMLSAFVRFFGLYLSILEWHDAQRDHHFAKKALSNGSRLLLARERLVGSSLSLVVQGLLVTSIIWIMVALPMHGRGTDVSMAFGTLVSVTLACKSMLTRAARRKIERESRS